MSQEQKWWVCALSACVLLGWTAAASATQSNGPVDVLQLRPDLYMLTVDGVNLALQTGPDGAVLVDTGPARASAAVLAQVAQLSHGPLRFVIDTSADPDLIGGNESISVAGRSLIIGWRVLRLFNNNADSITDHLLDTRAPIIARQEVLEQVVSDAAGHVTALALPSETFTRPQYNFRMNGQVIEVVRMPAAHSGGDSAVRFEGSDVVATGAIFDDTHFPVIDLRHGGSLQGEIDALNQLMNTLTIAPVPLVDDSGGTLVIPVHGPACDQADLLVYRDMISAVRDRVLYMIDHGKSLAQVEAADTTAGYDSRFGADTGEWTTRDFVEAVYRSLTAERKSQRRAREQSR